MLTFNIRNLFAPRIPLIAPENFLAVSDTKEEEIKPIVSNATRFKDVCEAYLAYLPNRARNLSVPDEIKFFRRYVMNPEFNSWTNKLMSEVTDEDVADFVKGFVKHGKPVLGRNCLAKVRAMLSWAMAPDRRRVLGLEANPVLHLTPRVLDLNVRHRRPMLLSREELRAYLLACERLPKVSDEILGKSLVFFPVRLNELTRAKWPDVDLEHGRWTVRSTDGTKHVHLLSSAATALLEELRSITQPAGDDFVFGKGAGDKGPRNRSRMKRMIDGRMKPVLHEVGLEFRGWTWHDLRRTAWTLLINLGFSDVIADIVIGRTNRIERFHSLSTLGANVREAVERLADELTAIRNGVQGLEE